MTLPSCAAVTTRQILIQVDKPSQTMTVSVDGATYYRWPVSTGASGFSTPDGSYKPSRMELMHYSREWDNAGMPHAIFFTGADTAFTARTIPASARRCRMAASA